MRAGAAPTVPSCCRAHVATPTGRVPARAPAKKGWNARKQSLRTWAVRPALTATERRAGEAAALKGLRGFGAAATLWEKERTPVACILYPAIVKRATKEAS